MFVTIRIFVIMVIRTLRRKLARKIVRIFVATFVSVCKNVRNKICNNIIKITLKNIRKRLCEYSLRMGIGYLGLGANLQIPTTVLSDFSKKKILANCKIPK